MISKIQHTVLFLSLFSCFLGCSTQKVSQSNTSPNIIIVFIDDMGWADVGFNGGTHVKTPRLDQMAKEGLVLTDFYVAQPVCSASRSALLTGCYPNRIGISGALGPHAKHGINVDEITIAEICKERGYATAIFGKWHIGHLQPFLPTNHGFDTFVGIPYSNDMWPMHPEARKGTYPPLPYFNDDVIVYSSPDQTQFTKDFTNLTIDFIKEHKNEPFFVYVPHPMVHVPLHVSKEWDGATGLGLYADVVAEIDDGVGRIIDTVNELGIEDHTLIIFTSDNGPWLSYGNHGGQTGIYREGKGTTFEGGVRVPFVAWWPGTIAADSTSSEPLMTIDILPTIAEWLEVPLPNHTIDGQSAVAIFEGEADATSPQEAYYFYYHKNNLEAIRWGKWKLHFPHGYRSMGDRPVGSDGTPGKYDYSVKTGLELYNLETDPSETTNVRESFPKVMEKFATLASKIRNDLGDSLTDTKQTNQRMAGKVE
jgi:arylsulfatase A-like enzyme